MAKTILVVDDEKRLVSLVESYLTQGGYHVVTAHDGKEALAVERGSTAIKKPMKIARSRIHLVLFWLAN